MSRTRAIRIPLFAGQREDIDHKLLPLGALTRAKNVRLRKDGRWGVRYGDTALALTTNAPENLRPTQLVAFDDRLFAIGDANYTADVPATDVYEFVDQAQFAWASSDPDTQNLRIGRVTGVRDIARPSSQEQTVEAMDCAAAGGLVCMVFETDAQSTVHVVKADTDTTVLMATLSIERPRVVAIDGVFFIAGLTFGQNIELYSYDPATDSSIQSEGTTFSTGAVIEHWDFAPNPDNDGAWIAVHLNTPATTIIELDSSGAVAQTFDGPATALTYVSICQTSTRVHLAVVDGGDDGTDLYSYTLAGVLSSGPTQLASGSVNNAQPALADVTVAGGTETVCVFANAQNGNQFDVVLSFRNATTHAAVSTPRYRQSHLTAKPFVRLGTQQTLLTFGVVQDTGSFATNHLVQSLGISATGIGATKDGCKEEHTTEAREDCSARAANAAHA